MRLYPKMILAALLAQALGLSAAFALPSADDFQLCRVNGRERLWAQHRLNTDLMNTYIDEQHLRDPALLKRVYVLDSGFDSNQIPNLLHAESFSAEPGVYGDLATHKPGAGKDSLVGDPAQDISGHGTMVVSVIAAKDGIGVASHTQVSLLRITPPSDAAHSDTTSDGFIDYAMLQACNEGRAHDASGVIVINDSWATRASESGQLPLVKRNPQLVQKLRQLGCLVVQAAGNNAFVGPLALESDDRGPLLQVSATESFNLSASFSSSGLLAAPGEKVYALASHFVNVASRNDVCDASDKLGETPRTFVSGTSFSSPMTAGIAAEIAGVLESNANHQFLSLSAPEKVSLVIRILEASAIGSSNTTNIDALRAILIAERWKPGVFSVKELKNLLSVERPKICGTEPQSFGEKRFFVSACSESVSSETIAAVKSDLAETALSSKAFESTAGFLDLEHSSPTRVEEFAQKYVASKARGESRDEALSTPSLQLSLRLGLDASFSRTLMPAYLKLYAGRAPHLMLALLTSWSTEHYLERGAERGSEPILKALVDNLEMTDANLVNAILTDFTHYWLGTLNMNQVVFNADVFSTVVRVLNEVRHRPRLQFLSPGLDELDVEVLAQLNQYPALFGKDLDQFVIGAEVHQNRIYLFNFFDRLGAVFYQTIQDEHPEKTAQVAIEYVLEKKSVSGRLSLNFLAQISNVIDTNETWKFSSLSLKQELPDLTRKQLLLASVPEVQVWLNALHFSKDEPRKLVDEIAYQIARDLSRSKKIDLSHQPEMRVLQTILNHEPAAALLHQGGFGKSSILFLKASVLGSRRSEFPSSFIEAISSF